MKKNDTALNILFRVFLQVIKTSPLTGILSLIYNIIEGLFPAYITSLSALLFEAVSKYINSDESISQVSWLGAMLILGYGLKQFFQYVSSITINAGVYEKVKSSSNELLYKKCSNISLIKYEDATIMDCKARASDCVNREIISQLYLMNVNMITSAIGIISTIAVLASYNSLFIPISILSVIPYFIARIVRGKEFYELKKHQIKKERRKNYLWSIFTNKQSIKEMRVMGFGDYISKKWTATRDEVNEETWNLAKKDSLSLLICDLLRILGYGFCILLSFLLTIYGQISVAIFSACISAFSSVQGQTKSFLIELGNIPEKINFARDYFDFIDRTEENHSCKAKTKNIKKLNFKNVSFAYTNSQKYAISDLSIAVKSGEKIAIIGENGSGKTTFTKLLLGIYKPDSGTIEINNKSLSQYDNENFLKKVSIISQQFIKYHMTLRENVALSNIAEISNDESINCALQEADFCFEGKNIDLDTILGTEFGGAELSGGQWQKLAIARGIFRDSELIIMDEPTSAIDPIAETEILKNFIKIAKNKTAIIISHRIGLCTLVDKIALMKDGHIIEFGTHEKLLKENGEYAKLFNTQMQWYI